MLCLKMAPEVNFSLEGPTAPRTAEGFKSRVFAAVGDEVRALAEGFPAVTALVRFFT